MKKDMREKKDEEKAEKSAHCIKSRTNYNAKRVSQ